MKYHCSHFKSEKPGSGERPRGLKGLAFLAGDRGSFPSVHMVAHSHQKDLTPPDTHDAHTYVQAEHSYV